MPGLICTKKAKKAFAKTAGLRYPERDAGLKSDVLTSHSGSGSVDPIFMLTDIFTRSFDEIGKRRSAEMAGEAMTSAGSRDGQWQTADKSPGTQERSHDSPEYVHSRRELNEHEFADRFSAYAFRGGKLANAVMAGQGRKMFTVCLSRALGRSFQGGERQSKLLSESASGMPVGGMSAHVRFNQDAQSAVSIVTDAVRGSTRILELFTKLANGSGQEPDTPLEMRHIETMRTAFPFLQTGDDRLMIRSCRERLRALENSSDPAAMRTSRLLRSALIKQTAVLRRKEEQQRNFLTKLNEINSNVREAEKLFSTEGFAQQALCEAEELIGDDPPDDGKWRRTAFEAASEIAEFISGLRGDQDGKAQTTGTSPPENAEAGGKAQK